MEEKNEKEEITHVSNFNEKIIRSIINAFNNSKVEIKA